MTEGYDLGFTHYDCVVAISSDTDSDGVDDTCEHELAVAFNPQLLVADVFDTSREPTFAVNNRGGSINIIYMMAYHSDYGYPGSVYDYWDGGHNGDSEFVEVDLEESGGVWKVNNVFMSAHWNTDPFHFLWQTLVFDRSDRYDYNELEYADVYRGRPRVWVAVYKHANYPTKDACNAHFDTCYSGPYTVDALEGNDTTRNVGSSMVPLIDSIASESPSTYPGTEAFWSPVYKFFGWHGGGVKGATPYHQILGTFGYDEAWNPSFVSVTISGPDPARPNNNCNWTVAINGGNPPYDYEWFRLDSLVSTYTSYQGNTGDSDFILNLRVTDKFGFTATDYHVVGIDEGADPCVER